MPIYRSHVLVCGGTGCTSSGAQEVMDTFQKELKARGLDQEVLVVPTGCHGMCEMGPIVVVYPEGTFYCRVTAADVKEITEEHLFKGRVVDRLLYSGEEITSVPNYKEIPFYGKQERIALANCGYINPDNIEEYIARDGYAALAKAITEMTPEDIIEQVKTSGLKGSWRRRFPHWSKVEFLCQVPGRQEIRHMQR